MDDDDVGFNPQAANFDEPNVADDLEGYSVNEEEGEGRQNSDDDSDALFDDSDGYTDGGKTNSDDTLDDDSGNDNN